MNKERLELKTNTITHANLIHPRGRGVLKPVLDYFFHRLEYRNPQSLCITITIYEKLGNCK